jgi:hypothetical protein
MTGVDLGRAFSVVLILPLAVLISRAQQEPRFASRANLVSVPTLVRDASGSAVYGLHANDFIIEDDGVAETVHLDERNDAEPLSLMIAVERGRRAKREFGRIGTLASMLDPILTDPNNEAALLLFDRREEGRRLVLLLVSETRDHGSKFTRLDDLVRLVGENNVLVFTAAFSPYLSKQLDTARGTNQDEWTPNIDLLEKLAATRQALRKNIPQALAAMTGGEYQLFLTRNGFENDLTTFSNHLDSRYQLSFEPDDPHPGFHRLRVRLGSPGKGWSVVYRSSYWAEPIK